MGTSRPYTIFAGIVEITGCVFLLFRRTTTIGALVSAAALANVVVLDFSYGVPIKLGAINLLLMAIFLLVPDLGRLTQVLLLNRAIEPAVVRPLWPARRWTGPATITAKTIFIAYMFLSSVQWDWKARERILPPGPLLGIYDVERFIENGRERPSLATESNRWSRVAVMDRGKAQCAISIRNSDDSMLEYQCVIRPEQSALKLSNPLGSMSIPASSSSDSTSVFTYSRPDDDHLMLQNSQFTISMKRLNPSYPRVTSGPHWIDNGVNR